MGLYLFDCIFVFISNIRYSPWKAVNFLCVHLDRAACDTFIFLTSTYRFSGSGNSYSSSGGGSAISYSLNSVPGINYAFNSAGSIQSYSSSSGGPGVSFSPSSSGQSNSYSSSNSILGSTFSSSNGGSGSSYSSSNGVPASSYSSSNGGPGTTYSSNGGSGVSYTSAAGGLVSGNSGNGISYASGPGIRYSSSNGGPSNSYTSGNGGFGNSFSSSNGGLGNSYSSSNDGPGQVYSPNSGGSVLTNPGYSQSQLTNSDQVLILDNSIENFLLPQQSASSAFSGNHVSSLAAAGQDEPLFVDNSAPSSGVLNLNPPIQYYVNEPMLPHTEPATDGIDNVDSVDKRPANNPPVVIQRFTGSLLKIATPKEADRPETTAAAAIGFDARRQSDGTSRPETSGIRPTTVSPVITDLSDVEEHEPVIAALDLSSIKLTTTTTAAVDVKSAKGTSEPDTSTLFMKGGELFSTELFNLFNFGKKHQLELNCLQPTVQVSLLWLRDVTNTI